MPGNREVQKNGGASNSINSAADEVEEVMKSLTIEDGDGDGGGDERKGKFPDRPGEPDCLYFLRKGTCGYGSNCRFNHPSNAGRQVNGDEVLPERAGQQDCGYYLRTGTCKYGSTCKYHHPKQIDHPPKDSKVDPLVSFNSLGLPMRQDAKQCDYYMRTGSCRYGYACKFHHPQPPLAANVVPMVRPGSGSGTSVLAPSSGPPSGGKYSAMSLPEATYVSPSFPPPPNYMPIYVSPFQGWDTYAVSGSYLPERPDQPECRYFMNHGTCKYGSDCKYHHPREKMQQQVAVSSFGSIALPLRPGQPVCSQYNFYGVCNYGPACKFDHPMNGYNPYPYAYTFNLPLLSSPYAPSSHYPGMPSLLAEQSSDNNKNHRIPDMPDSVQPSSVLEN